jgi:acetyl esterase/lipase
MVSVPDSPDSFRSVRNVTQPSLTVFAPPAEFATGTAVIVCPGGAHHLLSIDHEGIDAARWLVHRGVAAFVLKYRLIATPASDDEFEARFWQIMAEPDRLSELVTAEYRAHVLADGQRAVAHVRDRAADWSIAPDRIGMLGFSAGGAVAVAVGLQHDHASRPDFVAPIYSAVQEDVAVPPDAPPLFLALAGDDPLGERIVGASVGLYSAWLRAGRTAELHAYATGGHGFGTNRQDLPVDGWIDRFHEWLIQQGLLTPIGAGAGVM